MKTLFAEYQGITLSEIKLDAKYANSAVLVKTTYSVKTDTIKHKLVLFTDLKDTKPVKVVSHVLKAMIAEYRVNNEYTAAHSKVQGQDSGIKFGKLYSTYLNSYAIYRVNSEGKLAVVLISDIKLSQTALKVKETHLITTCKNDLLRAAIHNQATAIVKQSSYIRDVDAETDRIIAETVEASKDKATVNEQPKTAQTA